MENKLLNLAGQRKCNYSTLSLSLFILIFFTFGFTKYSKAQTAAFTPSATQSCSPANVSFTDNSTGATSWLWDFGNSNTATTQNASANYPQPGTYSVTLTINGGASTITKLLSIYPKLSLTTPAVVQGCAPLTTSLTALATPVTIAPFSIGSSLVGGITGGAATSYTWNFFGDLPTVTENDPVLDLTNVSAGTYDVLLTVTDDKGCSNFLFKQGIITVHPKPDADFTFVKENVCGVGNVTFSGISSVSSGSIANYSWDIGNDGSIESTLQNYTHNFTAAGAYDVAFTTTSSDLCSSDKIVKQVVFNSSNLVGFSFTGNCVGQPVAFTDASSVDVVSRDWDFGDGTAHSTLQNPSHTYTSTGDKTAKLTVTFTDGCVMETTHLVPVNGATSTFTYTTTTACAPNYTISFTSTATASLGSTITGYEWDFDNNGTTDDVTATPTYAFNASGTFPVRLTVTTSDGCSNSVLTNVAVPASGIDFTAAPDQGCAPLNPAFTPIYTNASDPILSYSWNFGDPVSGVNNISAVANPSHNYINTGEYDVTLTVTTTNGCVLTKNNPQIITVGAPQAISGVTYTQATLCQTSAVDFTASITTLTDQLVWDFNDGTPPVTQNVSGVSSSSISHGYAIPGLQSVTVQAWYNGCPSLLSFTLSNIIINEPTASFTPTSTVQCAVPASSISFTNTSHSNDAVTNYSWNFGDGQTSTAKNPSHIYNLSGDFTVTLTVNNTATGCSDQATSTVYVTTSVPQFTVNNTVICSASPVNFTNQVAANSSANFSAASYLWTFGDGQTSTDANPSHTYTTPGLYSVKLQVTEERGCVYSYTRANYIDVRGPIVNFTNNPTQICSGTLVTFTDASTIAPNDPANPLLNTFYWSFGDGNNSTNQNPTHTYFGTGSYTVNLQVTDNLGCVSSNAVTNSVSVPEVTAGFTTSRGAFCKNDIVTFTNSAVGTITAYDWDMNGDGTFEILNGAASQSFTYTATGVYSIKQRITSNLGCQDVFTKAITIVDGTAGIYISSLSLGCAPAFGQFEATDAAVDVASYLWNFGDGQTSVLRNPNHYFILPGSYTVSLTENLTGGCTRTSSVVITVDGAVGTFTYDITPGCANHTINYNVTNLSGVTELTWDFGDGITFTEPVAVGVTSKSTTHTYSTWGNRLPILILRDPACGDYSYYFGVNQRINTSEAPTPAFSFVSISGQTCEKLSFQFTDQSTRKDPRYNISTWDWDFGDGSPHSNLQNPIHMYTAAGTYTATLTVTNGFIPGGCGSSVSHNIIVNPLPVVSATNQTQEICSGTSSSAMVLSGTLPGTTFAWTRTTPAGIITAQAASGTTDIPGSAFTNSTSAPVVVTYTIIPTGPTPTFCIGDPITATVTVNPIPSVTSATTKSICNTTSVAYTPTSAVAGTTYSWTASLTSGAVTGFTASGSGPIADLLVNSGAANGSVTYVITPTGPAPTFCTGSSQSLVVTVHPTPIVTAPLTAIICSGNSAAITLSTSVPGTTFYYAAPAISGSAGNITGGAARFSPGNTNAISDILVNTTAAVQTATYTVYPIINGCIGTSITIVVTVNPVPIVTTGIAQGICADATFNAASNLALTTNPAMAGALFTYAAPVNTGGMTGGTDRAVGSTANISDVFINNTNTVQTATYNVTATAPAGIGGCAGAAKNVVITVYPRPLITSSLTGATCSSSAFLYTITSNVASSSFNWTRALVAGISNAAGSGSTASINETLINTTGSSVDVSYILTPTGPAPGTCAGTPSTLVVTVRPRPSVTAGLVQSFCSGSTASLVLTTTPDVPGTTFSWPMPTISGGAANIAGETARPAPGTVAPITDVLTNTTTSTRTATYVVTPTSPLGCVGLTRNVVISVYPNPTVTSAATKTICNNASVAYTPTSATASTTFAWTASLTTGSIAGFSASGTGAISDILVNSGTASGTVTYVITPTGPTPTFCIGTPRNLVVTIQPTPTVTATPAVPTFCSGGTTSIVLSTTVPGTTFYYATPTISGAAGNITGGAARATPGSTAAIVNTLINTTAAVQTATYNIVPIIGSCTSSSVPAIITVNPVPIVTTGLTQGICTDASFNATSNLAITSTPAMAGALYTYPAPVNTGGMTGGTDRVVGSSANITDVFTNNTNTAQTATYSVSPAAPAGVGGCAGVSTNVVITVYPRPLITSSLTGTACSGSPFAYTITSNVAGSTFTWTRAVVAGISNAAGSGSTASINETLINTTGSSVDVSYILTPTGPAPGACAGTPSTLVVTVNPTPAVTAGLVQSNCSGTASNLAITTTPDVPGTTYSWTSPTISGVPGNITGGTARLAPGTTLPVTDNLINTTTSPQTATYIVTPASPSGCIGATRNIVITVNPIPTVTSSSVKSICNSTSVAYTPTSATASTTFAWTASLTTGSITGFTASGSGQINDVLVNAGTADGSVTYVIISTGPAPTFCAGTPFTFIVTVRPTPTVSATPAWQSFCSGGTTSIVLSTTVPGTTFYYDAPAISGVPGNITGGTARLTPGNTNAITDILVNTTATVQTATYTVYPVISGCIGTAMTVVITVNPVPIVTTGLAQGICTDATFNSTSNLAVTTTPAMAGALFTYPVPVNTGGMAGGTARVVGSTANISDVFINNTNTAQTATYSVTATAPAGSGGCAGTARNVVVTVYPQPLITSSLVGTTCSGSAFLYSITGNVAGSTFTWTRAVVAGISNAVGSGSTASINETLLNTTGIPIDVSYVLTPTGPAPGTCTGTPSTLLLTVNPRPAGVPQAKAICSGDAVNQALTTSPVVPGTTFTYAAPAVTGGITGGNPRVAGSSSDITDILINPTAISHTATYTITPTSPDGCPGSTFTVVVTVNPTPTAPTASTTLQPTCLAPAGTITITAPTGVGMTYSIDGLTYTNTTGIFTMISSGTYIVTVKNAVGCISSGTSVTVNPKPDCSPVANDDNGPALTEDGPNGTVNLLTNDTDPDGNPTAPVNGIGQFTVDLDPVTAGIQAAFTDAQGVWTLNNATGVVTFDPANNYNGTAVVSYTLCDPTGLCDNANITFVVTPANDPPVANDDNGPALTEDGPNGTVSLISNDTDPDGNPTAPVNGIGQFTVDLDSGTAGIQTTFTDAQGVWTLNNATGVVTFDPANNYNGTAVISYALCDPSGACDNANITFVVTPTNDPPVANDDNGPALTEDGPNGTVNLISNDTDPDGNPTAPVNGIGQFTVDLDPVTAGIQTSFSDAQGVWTLNTSTGVVTFDPANNYNGTAVVSYTLCDPTGLCDNANISFLVTSVDDAPTANADYITTNEDTQITGAMVTGNDIMSGDGGNTWTIVSTTSNGTLTFTNGTYDYIPNVNFNGTDSFIYQICDTDNDCDTAIVYITVSSVDDAPTANADYITTSEDTQITGAIVTGNDILSGDGGNAWTLVSTTSNGTLTFTNGTYDYTPNADFNGTDSFIYQLCDTDNDCDTAIVYITVSSVNDSPTANADYITTNEDTQITGAMVTGNDIMSGDGGNTWTIVSTTSNGTLTFTNGTYDYTPNANFNGTDSFIYQLCDTDNDCDTAIVYITVSSVDDAPTAIADYITTNEDTQITGAIVTGNDILSGDGGNAWTLVSTTTNGTLTFTNGTYDYTPNADFNGTDSFIYQLCDTDNDCDTAIVYITVSSVDDAPTAIADYITTNEDTQIAGAIVTGNDILSGDGGNAWTLVSTTSNGTLTFTNGTYDYTPNADFNGTDSFIYQICDTDNDCDTAIVYITITPIDDSPVVSGITSNTPEDTPITICRTITDPDAGSVFTASICGSAVNGSISAPVVTGDQVCFTYTPDPNFIGTDQFCIEICDNGLPVLCDTAIVTVNVGQVNDPPVVTGIATSTPEDTPITICLPVTDADAGSVFTASICGGALNGILSEPVLIAGQVCITYTPNANFNGSEQFCIGICDNGLPVLCDTAIITVIVNPVNDSPVVFNESVTTCNNTVLTGNILANGDLDPDGTSLMVEIIPLTSPSNGIFTVLSNGDFTYTPSITFGGNDTIVVSVCDNGIPMPSGCTNDTIIVTVIPSVIMTAGSDTTVCEAAGSYILGSAQAQNFSSILWTTSGSGTFNDPGILNPVYTPGAEEFIAGRAVLAMQIQGLLPCGDETDSITLVFSPAPVAGAGNDATICNSAEYEFKSATASHYTSLMWEYSPSNAGTLSDATVLKPIFTPSAGFTGNVTLKLKATGNPVCSSVDANDEMVLTVVTGITLTAGSDQIITTGAVTTFQGSASGGSGIYEWTWEPSALLQINNIPRPMTLAISKQTLFTATVVDVISGCSAQDAMVVSVAVVAQADYDSTLINTATTIQLLNNDSDAGGDTRSLSICEDPAHGVVVINPDKTITYTPDNKFIGDDKFCYMICNSGNPLLCDTATVFVHVIAKLDDLIIYNLLTPNGDNSNDTWYILGIEDFPDNTILLFNRWGDRIRDFERYDNKDVFWDGTNNKGEILPSGTYYYLLTIKDVGSRTGWIYLRGSDE